MIITKLFCTDCNQDIESKEMVGSKFCEHDCPESPENIKKRADEYIVWKKKQSKLDAAWDKWADKQPCMRALPSVEHMPRVHAVEGKCILVDYGDYTDYTSGIIENPTWGKVMLRFNDAMRITDDYHHCYLEGLQVTTRDQWPKGLKVPRGVKVYKFSKGS